MVKALDPVNTRQETNPGASEVSNLALRPKYSPADVAAQHLGRPVDGRRQLVGALQRLAQMKISNRSTGITCPGKSTDTGLTAGCNPGCAAFTFSGRSPSFPTRWDWTGPLIEFTAWDYTDRDPVHHDCFTGYRGNGTRQLGKELHGSARRLSFLRRGSGFRVRMTALSIVVASARNFPKMVDVGLASRQYSRGCHAPSVLIISPVWDG